MTEGQSESRAFNPGPFKSPKNPRGNIYHKYNLPSRVLFCWLDSLIYKGFRRGVSESDIYACPSEADSQSLLDRFNKYWKSTYKKSRLWLVLIRCLIWRILLHGAASFSLVVLLVLQPFLLGFITDYFTYSNPTAAQTRDAYLYAMGLSLVAFSVSLNNGLMGFNGFKLGMLARVISSSIIYQKILKLSQSTIGRMTIGHIVNLASNDVHRFDQAMLFYHFIWIGPLHLIAVTVFIYFEIGPTAFLATFLVLIQIPLQYMIGRLFTTMRLTAAKVTDERVVIMNEVISGMRVIKMYGWEYAFHQLVANTRKREIRAILRGAVVRIINLSYFNISLPTIMFIIFTVYVYADENNILTPRKVFTTFAQLTYVRLISLTFMLKAITQIFEAKTAIERIGNFLSLDDLGENTETEKKALQPSGDSSLKLISSRRTSGISGKEIPLIQVELDDLAKDENGLIVRNLSASWTTGEYSIETLSNISFKVDRSNPLLAVIGAVGSGKSTLLQCLLKELPLTSGQMTIKGSIAYASQEPWIFSTSLRDNILFGLPYNDDWYKTVIDNCALDKDIEVLPDGDLTLVGERGVTLSGGQKARVSLARAVYSRADIYLLDDPLSAVDAAVSRHIFDRCIRGLLSNHLVVLVTHQVQYLQQCDQVLGLIEGCMSVYGDSDQVMNEENISKLLGEQEKKDDDLRQEFAIRKNSLTVPPSRDVLSALQPNHMLTIDEEEEEEEEEEEGKEDLLQDDVELRGTKSLTNFEENLHYELDDATSVYSAPPLPPPSYTTQKSIQSEKEAAAAEEIKQVTLPKEERATGTISFMTYIQYFVAGGGYIFTVFLFILYVINEGILVSTDWWIADWADCDVLSLNFTDNNSTHATCNLTTQQRTGIYFTFVAFVWFISLFRNFLFFFLALRSARVLHNRMFSSILRSPVLFFDTNPIGRVLNRFSKDIGFLDDILIYTFCEFLILMFRFFGILVASIIANPYLAIPVVVLCVVFAAFRWYYLKSARDIKRVEALSRSPLYSHISMTLQGLCTIRAYKMEDIAMTQFHHYQNIHTQAWYLYIASSRWFGYRIDLISSTFISCVCFISIPLAGSINPGLIGLALSYALTLNGMFQYCIRQSAEVESLMVSAERVISYGKLDSEASLETIPPADAPPSDWPTEGQIELKDLCYRHSTESPLVLKGLNCVIRSREKVGIVGRTGAGKSSLIAAIFRLAEPTGSIIIDGIDCLKLGLHDLRSKISIIPQDPVLFTGTIRYNLDPFNSYTDEDIWRSLEQVQLKYQVEVLEGGLEAFVSEGGGNFSVGQRQLFCLARALLRNNKILMLDEATANVDLETDAIIQQVIRSEFSHCTILTIAHRLDTVMDSDKIMVLRFGELIEFGEPHELMGNTESYLLRLVDHTGPIASAKLKEMALNSHNARNKID